MIQRYLFPLFEEDLNDYQVQCTNKSKNSTVSGLGYCSKAIYSRKYGIPKIKAYYDVIPDKFITYSESSKFNEYSCGVSSFDDDFILDRVWRNAGKYIPIFSKFQCVCEPDFSLKLGYPLALQISNKFKNHALAFYMQDCGLKVMPTISWSSTDSFDFCFDGYEKGGAVIVSTIGTLKDERSSLFFKLGFEEMIKRISPDAVVIYGDKSEHLINWMPKQLQISFVSHNRYLRARNHGRKRII